MALKQFFIERKCFGRAGKMPGFLVPMDVCPVRLHSGRAPDAPPSANPVSHQVPHAINGAEPGIFGQIGQEPCYQCLREKRRGML
jgi:hypothetical protein